MILGPLVLILLLFLARRWSGVGKLGYLVLPMALDVTLPRVAPLIIIARPILLLRKVRREVNRMTLVSRQSRGSRRSGRRSSRRNLLSLLIRITFRDRSGTSSLLRHLRETRVKDTCSSRSSSRALILAWAAPYRRNTLTLLFLIGVVLCRLLSLRQAPYGPTWSLRPLRLVRPLLTREEFMSAPARSLIRRLRRESTRYK